MSPEACEKALIAKLASQDAKHLPERSTTVSMFFMIEGKGFTFPRPLTDFGWTSDQQDFIATTLEYCGLDFWPLDYNL
jgi:hypothetical protein